MGIAPIQDQVGAVVAEVRMLLLVGLVHPYSQYIGEGTGSCVNYYNTAKCLRCSCVSVQALS